MPGRKTLPLVAMSIGIALGSYGIAAAASGTGGSSAAPQPRQHAPETALTGEALAKVTAAAKAELGGGAVIVRVEADADGIAAYEAHARKADGSPVTVFIDAGFKVVRVEAMPFGRGGPHGRHSRESVLTGDALDKVTAAAKAELGDGATIDRVETDDDGNSKYEAHATKADGTRVTVYVDASYDVVSVETMPMRGPAPAPSSST